MRVKVLNHLAVVFRHPLRHSGREPRAGRARCTAASASHKTETELAHATEHQLTVTMMFSRSAATVGSVGKKTVSAVALIADADSALPPTNTAEIRLPLR